MPIRRGNPAIRFLFAAAFAAAMMGEFADAQPAADIRSTICATVTLLEGASTLAPAASSEQRPLAAGETLSAGSILQTGGNSKVELTLADRSIVRINEDSSVELAADVGNGKKQAGKLQIKLLKGEMWVTLLDQPEGIGSLQVLVSGALLAGNKTAFRAVLFQDGAAEIKVYSGYVTASGPFVFVKEASRFLLRSSENDGMGNTEPWRHRIEPYRKMILQASGKETKPFRFTAKADLSAWVTWNRLRDADIK